MAEALQFDLVSPEEALMSEAVEMVIVPGSEGDFGVLAEHAPLMSTLRPGVVQVHRSGEGPFSIFVRGGFAEVTPGGLTILAEEAIPLENLETSDLDDRIEVAKQRAEAARSDDDARDAAQYVSDLQFLRDNLEDFRKA
ncbi:MAG: F0F1 ATP synthase subunit epsilon [Pseudomonadota bacterium]